MDRRLIGMISSKGLVAGVCAGVSVCAVMNATGFGQIMSSRRRIRPYFQSRRGDTFDTGLDRIGVQLFRGITAQKRLERAIAATGITWPTEKVVVVWICVFVSAVLIGVHLGGIPIATVAAVGLIVSSAVLLRANRHRGRNLADRALPIFLESVARSLRSGASLTQAVVGARSSVSGTALSEDADALVVAVERGAPMTTAFSQWVNRSATAPRRLAATALSLVAETGGVPGPLVDAVAQTLRERDHIEREARALATQARASAAVIAVAPVAFTVIAATVDPEVASFLFRSPIGITCLVVGLGAEGFGAWWMARITGGTR